MADGWEGYRFETYKDPRMVVGTCNGEPTVIFAISGTPCEQNRVGRYEHADVDNCATDDLALRVAECLRVCQGLPIEQLRNISLADVLADAKRYARLKARARTVPEDGGWAGHWSLPTLRAWNASPNPKYAMQDCDFDSAVDALELSN